MNSASVLTLFLEVHSEQDVKYTHFLGWASCHRWFPGLSSPLLFSPLPTYIAQHSLSLNESLLSGFIPISLSLLLSISTAPPTTHTLSLSLSHLL